jgi:DNA polymerase-3 subunit delta
MPYLFYGDNTFLINRKVKNWTLKFRDQFGDLNISILEGTNFTFEDYSRAVSSAPFLGAKRLIIIKNFLLNNKDELLKKKVAESLKKIPETSVVLFAEHGMPDMRTSLFKALNNSKFSERIDNISTDKLGSWIVNKVKEEAVDIGSEAKIKLQVFVGSDMWRLENEIKKLTLFVKSRNRNTILPEDVEKMVKAENSSNIFQFVDAIASGNSRKALLALKDLTDSGEDEFYIFSMIIYQIRNLFYIFELNSKGLNRQSIAKEAKIHPFVVSKSYSLLRMYSREKLKNIYFNLFQTDKQIKSGLINPSLALLMLTVHICKGSY